MNGAEDSNLLSQEKRCISIFSKKFEIAEVLQSKKILHFLQTFFRASKVSREEI